APADLPESFPTQYDPLFNRHIEYSIHDDLLANPAERDRPAAKAGMRSAPRVPLRVDGRVGGTLEFCSKAVGAYRDDQTAVATRIADYVSLALAHQRMADQARRADALRARAEAMRVLDELLRTLSGALDVREIFHRVQPIAQQVIPHDGMTIGVLSEDEK